MKKNSYVIINNEKTLDVLKMKPYEDNYILLDYEEVLNSLYKSFNYSKSSIYTQFKNDFPRCSYIINNNIEKSINVFSNYFEFSMYKYNIKPYIIFMICNQAIMGIALEHLHKNLKKKDYYIGELKEKSNLIFNFINNNNNLYLKISKVLRLFSIIKDNKDIKIKKISINIFISLNEKDKIIILYKILKI